MNKCKIFFISTLLMFSTFLAHSQKSAEIDSLENSLKKQQHDTLRVRCLLKLVNKYLDVDMKVAKNRLNDALVILNKNQYSAGNNFYYVLKCREGVYESKNDIALFYAKKAQESSLKSNDLEMYVYGCYYEAIIYSVQNNLSKCINKLNTLLKYLENKKEMKVKSDIYVTLASIYSLNQNYNLAIQNFEKAILVCQKFKNQTGIANSYYEISYIYLLMKNYEQALKYSNKNLELIKKKELFNNRYYSRSLELLGRIYTYQNKDILAINVFNKALYYRDISGGNYDKWKLIHSLISAYIKVDNHKKVVEICSQYLKKEGEMDQNRIVLYSYLAFSEVKLNEKKVAIKHTNIIFSELKNNPNLNIEIANLMLLHNNAATVYNSVGDFKKAYYHLNEYRDISEEYNTKLNSQQINQLQQEFDSKETDLQIKQQTIENQKYKLSSIENKANFYRMFIFALALFGVFVFVVFSYFSNKKKYKLVQTKNIVIEQNNIQLEKSKKVIAKSLHEKELLLKEIHHRIKNNLQLITSLLSIQAREGNCKDIDDFVIKGQSKIASVLLIHQSLYQTNDFKEIVLQDYIENLVDAVKILFENAKTNILFSINTNNSILDVQSAMPLGLIINELISNSMKHAFQDRTSGTISIEMNTNDNDFEMFFSDDGIGMKENTKKTLGLKLVELLVSQLHGSIDVIYSNSGVKFHIKFKNTINNNQNKNKTDYLEAV